MAVNSRSRTVFYTTLRSLLAAPLPPSSPVSFGLKSARARPEGGALRGRAIARPSPAGAIPRAWALLGAGLALLGFTGGLRVDVQAAGGLPDVLAFFGLRFDGERDLESDEGEEAPDYEQAPEPLTETQYAIIGAYPLVIGSWAQWDRIYYLPKGQKADVVVLVVARAGKASDQTWTCADPSVRVQIVALKDKQSVFTRPPSGIVSRAPFPGHADATQGTALAAPQRLTARK